MLSFATMEEAIQKLAAGTLLAIIGLAFGWMAGGIYESMGIMSAQALPWQEFIAFLGTAAGFLFGLSVKIK